MRKTLSNASNANKNPLNQMLLQGINEFMPDRRYLNDSIVLKNSHPQLVLQYINEFTLVKNHVSV